MTRAVVSSRTFLLFILAVLLPGGALAVVGVLLVNQQQEVLTLREQDHALLTAREISDSLDSRLARLAATVDRAAIDGTRLLYPIEDSVLFLGRVEDAGWIPPFAKDHNSSISESGFQRRISSLRSAELNGRSLAALERDYANLANSASGTAQQSYLEIQRARILQTMGAGAEAQLILIQVTELGNTDVDEFGIPLSLYARALLGADAPPFHSHEWLNYEAQAFWNDLDDLVSRDEYALLRYVERIAPGLTGWSVDPDSTWVVGPSNSTIVAFRISSLSDIVADVAAMVKITPGSAGDSPSLGAPFPFLQAHLTPGSPNSEGMILWILGLVFILLLTAVGSSLLYRDVRRERKISDLRAQFVSSVSHEVRTPLTAIRLYTDSLLKYGPGDDDDWRTDLETISYETSRLTRMLDNVLQASRIERGTAKYDLKPGTLGPQVRKAISALKPALEEAGCSIISDVDDISASFDADAIEQAVVNLLSNASKYASGSDVYVECKRVDRGVVISVTDKGPGIDRDVMAHIFDPFYRGLNTSSGSTTGTGLGLSLVRHIARGHGGDAYVVSQLGEGSTFSIHLPVMS